MLRGTLCVLLGSLILFGCAGAITLQPLPADHPANPEAPEAPMQAAPQTLREEPGASSEGPGEDKVQEEGDYVCPMHPEVQASEPGRCSKCGMALKQREEE